MKSVQGDIHELIYRYSHGETLSLRESARVLTHLEEKRSNLTKGEFLDRCGISSNTFNNFIKGKSVSHITLTNIREALRKELDAEEAASVIEELIEKKKESLSESTAVSQVSCSDRTKSLLEQASLTEGETQSEIMKTALEEWVKRNHPSLLDSNSNA